MRTAGLTIRRARICPLLLLLVLVAISTMRPKNICAQPIVAIESAVLAGDWDQLVTILGDAAARGNDPVIGYLFMRACEETGCHERPLFRMLEARVWLEWTEALLDRHPENVHALNLSADAALRMGMLDTAMARTARAVALDPDNATGYHCRGRIFWRQGSLRSAISSLNIAAQKDPQSVAIYVSRGAVYRSDGRYQLALADYDKALSLDPANEAAHEGRGNVHHSLKEYGKAVEDYTAGIDANPRSSTLYLCRGLTYQDMGKTREALADCDSSIAIDPGDYEPYMAKGQLCEDLERFDEAAAAYRTYIDGASLKRADMVYQAMQSLGALVRAGEPYRTFTVPESRDSFNYNPSSHCEYIEYTNTTRKTEQLLDTTKFRRVMGVSGGKSFAADEMTIRAKVETARNGYLLTVTPLSITSTGTFEGYDNPPIEMGDAFSVVYEMGTDGSLDAIKGVARVRDEALKSLPPGTRDNPPPELNTEAMTRHYRQTWYDDIGQYVRHPAAAGAYWVRVDTIHRPGQNPELVPVYSATIVQPEGAQSGRPGLQVRTIQSTAPHVFDAVLDRPILEALGPGATPFTQETERYVAYDCLAEKVIDPTTMRIYSKTKVEWWHVRDPLLVKAYGDAMFWTSIETWTDTRREYLPD